MKKLIILLMVLLVIPLASAFNWNDGTLRHYYNFNEGSGTNIKDSVESNNITANGSWATGKIGTGMFFSGAGAFGNSTFNLDASFQANHDRTFNFWNIINGTVAGGQFFVCSGISTTNDDFCMGIDQSSGKWYLQGNGAGNDHTFGEYTSHLGVMTMHTITINDTSNEMKWYVNGVLNTTFSHSYTTGDAGLYLSKQHGYAIYANHTIDELGLWNRTLTASEILELYNSGGGLPYTGFTIDLTAPANGETISRTGASFNVDYNSASSPQGYEFYNTTYYIWYTNTTLFNSTYIPVTGTSNTTSLTVEDFNLGSYEWNVKTCYGNGTATFCTFADANYTFDAGISKNSETFNATTYETKSESFIINISADSALSLSDVFLNYAGTNYTVTDITRNANDAILKRTIDIPTQTAFTNVVNNVKWFFTASDGTSSATTETATTTQNSSYITFQECNGTYSQEYIRYRFLDELNLTNLTASINLGTFDYWIGSGAVNKTLTYTNLTQRLNFTYCFYPVDKTINLNYDVQYLADGFPQRRVRNNVALTNSSTTKLFYLLNSLTESAILTTFQVLNIAGQPLNNVFIQVTKTISGSSQVVGSGLTDASGGLILLLDSNFLHGLTATKSGYPDFTTSFFPSSEFTISMGTATTTTIDLTTGISYVVNPTGNVLNNNTLYTFNFTVSTDNLVLDKFGFILTNSSGSVLSTQSSTNEDGGTVSANVNTNNNTAIVMNYYWVVNNTYQNASKTWLVYDESSYNQFSILQFFEDLSTYISSGFFGADDFTVTLLSFLFIFIFTGAMAVKFGVRNKATLMAGIFSLVLFLDIGVGIIPQVGTGINLHIPTVFMGILTIAVLWREMT